MKTSFLISLQPVVFFIFSIINLICSVVVLSYIAHTKNISFDFNSSVFFAINIQQIHGITLLFSSTLLFFKNIFLLAFTSLLFSLGLVFFSLNIYLGIFFGIKEFSKLIPIGGILLFCGWGTLILAGVFIYLKKKIT